MPKLRYKHTKIRERVKVFKKETRRWVYKYVDSKTPDETGSMPGPSGLPASTAPQFPINPNKALDETGEPVPGPSGLPASTAPQFPINPNETLDETGVSVPGPSAPQFPIDPNTEEQTRSTYQARKQKRLQKWSDIQLGMLKAHTECLAPGQIACNVCDKQTIIRCKDCGPTAFFCEEHFEMQHKYCPFHCPEIWTGQLFTAYYPKLPTLVRADHLECECERRTKIVSVVGLNGPQRKVYIEYCSCEAEPETLLRHGLWAASPDSPTLAFHIDLMEWLRALVLDCQVSVKSFVDALNTKMSRIDQLTTNEISNLYQALVTDSHSQYMNHHYQLWHLQHIQPSLDNGTECPACDSSSDVRIVSFDANFGLVRKMSSGSSHTDPFHTNEYFMDQKVVDQFVGTYCSGTKKKEPLKECHNFRAGTNILKSKMSKLDETAVFGSACRHEFPLKFFNLKHGERLAYPVHLLKALLEENAPHQRMVVMYDIACVLTSHLKNTSSDILPDVQLVLPIFHSYGHKLSCQLEYGPRKTTGIGLTDGETMERLWSYLRKFATVTKEMTPERRIDLLVEALLHYAENLRQKYAKHLANKVKKAETMQMNAMSTFEKLKAASLLEEPFTEETLQTWREEEKQLCMDKDKKGASGVKQQYVLTLNELHQSRALLASSEGDDVPLLQSKVSMLTEKAAKQRKQSGTEHLVFGSPEYEQTLQEAVHSQREGLLEGMRAVAAERQYALSQLSQASGQAIAKKLSSGIGAANKKLKRLLTMFNKYQDVPGSASVPSLLQFRDVTDVESNLFLECSAGYVAKRKLLDATDLFLRSKEENVLLASEITSCHKWYQMKHQECCKLLTNLSEFNNRYNVGCRALLCQQMLVFEKRLLEIEKISALEPAEKPMFQVLGEFWQHELSGDPDVAEICQFELEEMTTLLEEGLEVNDEEDDPEDDLE